MGEIHGPGAPSGLTGKKKKKLLQKSLIRWYWWCKLHVIMALRQSCSPTAVSGHTRRPALHDASQTGLFTSLQLSLSPSSPPESVRPASYQDLGLVAPFLRLVHRLNSPSPTGGPRICLPQTQPPEYVQPPTESLSRLRSFIRLGHHTSLCCLSPLKNLATDYFCLAPSRPPSPQTRELRGDPEDRLVKDQPASSLG